MCVNAYMKDKQGHAFLLRHARAHTHTHTHIHIHIHTRMHAPTHAQVFLKGNLERTPVPPQAHLAPKKVYQIDIKENGPSKCFRNEFEMMHVRARVCVCVCVSVCVCVRACVRACVCIY